MSSSKEPSSTIASPIRINPVLIPTFTQGFHISFQISPLNLSTHRYLSAPALTFPVFSFRASDLSLLFLHIPVSLEYQFRRNFFKMTFSIPPIRFQPTQVTSSNSSQNSNTHPFYNQSTSTSSATSPNTTSTAQTTQNSPKSPGNSS
jgi:hypothetical protein